MTKSQTAGAKLFSLGDLNWALSVLKKNFFFLGFVLLLSYGVGFIYAHQSTEMHAAKAQILLKSNEVYNYQEPIYQGLGYYGMQSDITNQMQVLTSHDLVGQVVDKLDLNVQYFLEGRLKTIEMFGHLPFELEIDILDSSIYGRLFELRILDEDKYSIFMEGNEGFGTHELQFGEWQYVKPMFRVRATRNVSEVTDETRNLKYKFSVKSRDWLINSFKSRMKVSNVENTTILEVQVDDAIPSRAQLFLDSLTNIYVKGSKAAEMEINLNTEKYILRQLDTIKMRREEIDMELFIFKDSNDILDLDKEEMLYFEKMVYYDGLIRQEEIKKQAVFDLENYILNLSVNDKLLPPAYYVLDEDAFLRQLLTELYDLQIKKNEILSSNKEKNQKYQQNEDRINMTKSSILELLNNNLTAIQNNVNKLKKQKNMFRAKVKDIPSMEKSVRDIDRRKQINENMFVFLLEKLTNTNIARAGITPKCKVIEDARVIGVVSNNKLKIQAGFVLGGLIIGLVIAVVRFQVFARIENVKELKSLTTLPVLAGVPKADFENTIFELSPKSRVTETFRGIRSKLEFSAPMREDGKGRVIVVSSLHPGEGKTFVSSGLAWIHAMAQKKVVVIDLDLHKPKLHERLGIEKKELGASTYLIGKHDWKSAIIEPEEAGGYLHVLPAGVIPPNPSELVLSERLEGLIEEVRTEYDLVVIDTPPIGLITDARGIFKFCDSTIFVMNTKLARRRSLAALEEITQEHDEVSFSLVLNGLKSTRWSYYYSKYAYKYGYSYSYGPGYGYTTYSEDE